jgi:hypothetical protein
MRLGPLIKRTTLCLVVGLSVMVLVTNLTLPRRSSKWANFEKIKPGMTRAEVISIMGETEIYFPTFSHSMGWRIDATLFSDEYCLQATFEYKTFDYQEVKVTEKHCYPVKSSHFRRTLNTLGW